MNIRFIDFEGFKHTIEKIKELIRGKADKEHGHTSEDIETDESRQFISKDEKDKLSGVEDEANKYIHPDNHSADMITQSTEKQFVSGKEKADWNAKATTEYVDSHIGDMVGGIIGLVPETLNTLDKLANAIGNDPDFVSTVTTNIHNKVDKVEGMGLSSNDFTTNEKNKLLGIEDGANNYVHPDNLNTRHVSDSEKDSWNSKATINYVDSKVSELVDSAPETLDSLNKLSVALNNDPNFATTIFSKIDERVGKVTGKDLSTNDYTNEDKAKVDTVITDGDGLKYLASDGTYKAIEVSNGSVDIDDTIVSTSSTYSSSKISAELDKKADTGHVHGELHDHSNKIVLDNIINTGDGTKCLTDDGTYKLVQTSGSGSSDYTVCTEEEITILVSAVFGKDG